jgi:hypothetical protein
MNFFTDSYIEIGKTHEMCEDYALSSVIDDVPFIIVSDGCSSSKNTDVGSRLLTYACQNALRELLLKELVDDLDMIHLREFIKDQTLFNLRLSLKALCIPDTTADATLLLAFIHKEKMYYFIFGDGHALVTFNDGTQSHSCVSYVDNAPPYISYELDIRRKQRYQHQFGNGGVDFRCILDESDTVYSMNQWLDSGACASGVIDANNIKSITLTSDGIESYMYGPNATEDGSDVREVSRWYNEYTSYKSVAGEFVKRRMKRIKLNNEKLNIEHFDDVSCATIWINHE